MTRFLYFIVFCSPLIVFAQDIDSSRIKVLVQHTDASCSNLDDATIAITILEGQVPAVVQWKNTTTSIAGAGIIHEASTPYPITGLKAGTYSLYLSNTIGVDTNITLVIDAPPPLLYSLDFEGEPCFGASTGRIEIKDITGGTPPYFATVGNTPSINNTWNNLSFGYYFVAVEDAFGCIVEENVVLPSGLEFDFELGEAPVVFSGDTVSGQIELGRTLSDITWTPAHCGQFNTDGSYQIFAQKTTNITVTAVDPNGCKSEDQWQVVVKRKRLFYAPNVFTPETATDDNRVFSLFANGGIQRIEWMKISDREGRLWFTKENIDVNSPQSGWDGTAEGKKAPANVYFWAAQVRYTDGRSELITGDITLIR